jgi:hypothetical protein
MPDQEFVEWLKKQGKVWSPVMDPPEVETVPVDPGRLPPAAISEWIGKTTAWYAYAQSQMSLAEAQQKILQRRFSRLVNDLIVSGGLKQRTYDLQVAEAINKNPGLVPLQDDLSQLEAAVAMWSRMARAYEAYITMFRDEANRRRWDKT